MNATEETPRLFGFAKGGRVRVDVLLHLALLCTDSHTHVLRFPEGARRRPRGPHARLDTDLPRDDRACRGARPGPVEKTRLAKVKLRDGGRAADSDADAPNPGPSRHDPAHRDRDLLDLRGARGRRPDLATKGDEPRGRPRRDARA